MTAHATCPICTEHDARIQNASDGDHYDCGFCGYYIVTRYMAHVCRSNSGNFGLNAVGRAALSCRTRRSRDEPIKITPELIDQIRSSKFNPATHVNDLVRYIGDHISENGKPVWKSNW